MGNFLNNYIHEVKFYTNIFNRKEQDSKVRREAFLNLMLYISVPTILTVVVMSIIRLTF